MRTAHIKETRSCKSKVSGKFFHPTFSPIMDCPSTKLEASYGYGYGYGYEPCPIEKRAALEQAME
jgi:hypothetical protein